MYDRLTEEKQQLEEDREHLEQMVEQERRKREDVERRAQREISQLQAELQKLRRVQQVSKARIGCEVGKTYTTTLQFSMVRRHNSKVLSSVLKICAWGPFESGVEYELLDFEFRLLDMKVIKM